MDLLITISALFVAYFFFGERLITSYTIRKGKHRAWPYIFKLYLFKKKIIWETKFDYSAKYQCKNPVNNGDINKLVGIGFLPGIHKNSVRFGWRHYNNNIEILSYSYDKSDPNKTKWPFKWKVITKIQTGRFYRLELKINQKSYELTVIGKDGVGRSVLVDKTHNHKIGVRLNLFFGGDEKAPQRIKIYLKRL